MARKKSSKPSRRGGRKPGKWELVTPSEIVAFRQLNMLSRARMASLLGVSTTSIQNWETGRVASRKIQERLRSLIDDVPVLLPTPSEPELGGLQAARIRTTGAIVSAYLQGKGKALTSAQVADLVRVVRDALS